jgi:hypothetical protein
MCLLWGHNHAYLQCTKAPLIDCHSLHIVWGTCAQKPCAPMILSFAISRIWLMMASLFYVRLVGISNHLKAVLSRMACGCWLYRNNYITDCPIAINMMAPWLSEVHLHLELLHHFSWMVTPKWYDTFQCILIHGILFTAPIYAAVAFDNSHGSQLY